MRFDWRYSRSNFAALSSVLIMTLCGHGPHVTSPLAARPSDLRFFWAGSQGRLTVQVSMKPEEVYDDVLYASSAWNDGRPRLCTSVLPQSEETRNSMQKRMDEMNDQMSLT
jgi:hypothetical protein